MEPLTLAPNQPADRPYRGGAGILALRGVGSTDDHVPEDFLGSVTTVHGDDRIGLTVLESGETLRDAVASDPVGYLGEQHVARHGNDTGLLVKILSTGERLFNHVHPDAAFARHHLDSPRGKTEAWLITSTGDNEFGTVWVGFRQPVDRADVRGWIIEQNSDALLDTLNELTVTAGDWVYVPAGTPHSIGPDITLVEVQEPSDLSIILEYEPFPALDPVGALLGLDLDTALDALDFEPLAGERLSAVQGRPADGARVRLLPQAADEYFRAELLTPSGPVRVEPGFAVLVAIGGQGTLTWDGEPAGERVLHKGDVLLVPHSAGTTTIAGNVRVIRCSPSA